MTQHTCEEAGKECCGCCDDIENVIVRLDREFRTHLEACESEEDFALLRFRYLSAKGIINSILQKIVFDVEDPSLFQETVSAIFGFKIFVRTMFFLHSFEKEVVEEWFAGEGSTADVVTVTDAGAKKILDSFMREQSQKNPFEKLALHDKYLGPDGMIANGWGSFENAPESVVLSKGVNFLKLECLIETSLYLASRMTNYLLGTDPMMQWTDSEVYLAEMQFDQALQSCESKEDEKALCESYLGQEGIFEKQLALLTDKGSSSRAQWNALRDRVTSRFEQMGHSL